MYYISVLIHIHVLAGFSLKHSVILIKRSNNGNRTISAILLYIGSTRPVNVYNRYFWHKRWQSSCESRLPVCSSGALPTGCKWLNESEGRWSLVIRLTGKNSSVTHTQTTDTGKALRPKKQHKWPCTANAHRRPDRWHCSDLIRLWQWREFT